MSEDNIPAKTPVASKKKKAKPKAKPKADLWVKCAKCQGAGVYRTRMMKKAVNCPDCEGSGEVEAGPDEAKPVTAGQALAELGAVERKLEDAEAEIAKLTSRSEAQLKHIEEQSQTLANVTESHQTEIGGKNKIIEDQAQRILQHAKSKPKKSK